jgi:hypothetical protein
VGDSTVTLTLTKPVVRGSTEITELVMRKPKARDLRLLPLDLKSASMGALFDLAAMLCGQPPSVIDDLEAEDSIKLIDMVTDFLPDSPPTGA